MKFIHKIWHFILFDTYGNIALTSFVICSVSGIFLAVPYDIENAYDSVAVMLITNLPATIFRNMHYWSAQFFLVFTFLHTLEQIKLKTASDGPLGIWIRLVVSLLFVFFVMLSGFILKADADSLQAYRILQTLIVRIPWAGKFMEQLIFGNGNNFQLIYVHHIATATLFLFYIIFEHAATLWSRRSTFLFLLALFTILSFFAHAPLHDGLNPVLKGPWYFVGMQEIMHWTSYPAWIWILVLGFLALIFLSYYAGDKMNSRLYKILVSLTVGYLLLTVVGYFFRGENWEWRSAQTAATSQHIPWLNLGIQTTGEQFGPVTSSDIPLVQDKREACMICHTGVTGFSPAHDPSAIGCTSCHMGNPFTLDKDFAHRNMEIIPGNLQTAGLSCGTTSCHADISERIQSSLMTTNSGIVSVDRYVFGESHSPDVFSHIQDIGYGPADRHLRDLCANCHLGKKKTETGPIDQMSRGGGCNACHLNYSSPGLEQHNAYITGKKEEQFLPSIHPSLDITITNDHCFGCHSRSGRISTNYEGWHETLLDEEAVEDKQGYRVLQDKRVFEYIADDIHHSAGMDCIDCHSSYETMGDGNFYMHEEQAVKISCEDCHFRSSSSFISYEQLDEESKKIFDLRKFVHQNEKMLKTRDSDLPLINTILRGDKAIMISKNSGEIHPMNPPASVCTNENGHQNLSCSSCHTSWAPSCIGCHNVFDKNATGYDLLEDEFVKGEWVEYVGEFFAEAPTLGMREGANEQVEPAIPGMIMTIDIDSYASAIHDSSDKLTFHRLYAPVAPHTSSKKGRSCSSCHTNPVAIGYGRGKLTYNIENGSAFWSFNPVYSASKSDGLPEDAWIPVYWSDDLELPNNPIYSTRTDFRPFTIAEQKRILGVGACLNCHDEQSEIMMNSLNEDFSLYLEKVSEQCILPDQ